MVEIKTEIEINANIEKIWRLLTNFEKYPDWNPFIKNISGKKQIGEKLKVSVKPPKGEGMTFKKAKKIKMPNDTIEGADLALEIGSRIKKDFDNKKLPLMMSVIDSICNEMKLKINWNSFN